MDLIRDQSLVKDTKPLVFSISGQGFHVRPRPREALVWVSLTKRDARRPKLTTLNSEPAQPVHIFPALLDTGCTESLLLHEWHLEKWAQLPFKSFDSSDAAGKPKSLLGHKCPTIQVDLWLHPSFKNTGTVSREIVNDAVKLQISGGGLVSLISCTKVFALGQRKEEVPRRGLMLRLATMFRGQVDSGRAAKQVDEWGQSNHERSRDSIPYHVFPRLPLIGMKALDSNSLTLTVEGRPGNFSLCQTPHK